MYLVRWASALLLAAFWSPLFSQLTVSTDRATATYETGEMANFQLKSSVGGPATWEIRYDESTPVIASGTTNLTAGQAQIVPFTLQSGGAILCNLTQNGQKATTTAAFSPLQTQPSDAEPSDFDAFWNAQKAALALVPMAPQLTFYSQTSRSTTYRLNLGSIQNRRVYGFLSVPTGAGPFAAVVHFTAFGQNAFLTQPLDYVCDELGALVFAMSIHNAEPDQTDPNAYLPNEPTDREKYYYKQAILGGLRAIEYLHTRSDFDGQNVALFGESQGGGLALCVAGLDSRVDLVAVSTPALCDHGGYLKGKAAGFPQYVKWVAVGSYNDPVKIAAVSSASKYYDAAFFARRATCPALVVGGYLDDLNPAAPVFSAAAQLRKPLMFVHGARLGHAHPNEYWLGRNDLTRRFLAPTRTPQNNPFPPQGWAWVADAGVDLTVAALADSANLAGRVFQNQIENTTLPARWEVVSVPSGGQVWFSNPSARSSKAHFSAVGNYVLRFTAEDVSGAISTGNWLSYSDCLTVTVNNTITPPPPPPTIVHCSARAEEPWQQWIARVELAAINHASQKDGYADRSATVRATIEKGKNYPAKLTPGFSWELFNEYWTVWADWNQDFDFDDAGEKLFQANGTAAVAGSFAVPANAAKGQTRVRVAMKNGAFPTACGTFLLGEVEDFGFEVVDSIAAPPPPPPPSPTYCAAKGSNTTTEWTSRVRFSNLDFPSARDGYADRSATAKAAVEQTKNYSIRLTPSFAGGAQRQYWRVWADWNQDLDFDDVGELVFQNNSFSEVIGNIAIPVMAKTGTTRLRISMKRAAYAQPCESYTYGEVEDYGLTVTALVVPPPPPPAANYCSINSDFPWHEWISKVEVGPLFSNISSKEGYGDFLAQKIDVAVGQSLSMKTTIQFSWITHKEHLRAWVDWNQNRIFETSEVVFDQRMAAPVAGANVTASVSAGFSVPATAVLGETRMRIVVLRADNSETADACTTVANGEAEEYTVRVAASLAPGSSDNRASAEPTEAAGFLLFPTPTAGEVSLILDEKWLRKPLDLQLFGPQGIILWQRKMVATTEKEHSFDWSNLPSATYWLRLESAGIRPTMQKVVIQKL